MKHCEEVMCAEKNRKWLPCCEVVVSADDESPMRILVLNYSCQCSINDSKRPNFQCKDWACFGVAGQFKITSVAHTWHGLRGRVVC